MIDAIAVTLPPALFLIILFGGGALFHRKNIDQDGSAPINKGLFYSSKYLIVLVWAAMVAQSWGRGFPMFDRPLVVRWIALVLWFAGFSLLYVGRFGLGTAFRLGSPKESTKLKTGGLFSLSRNPMYVGVYSTVLASILGTLNPFVLVVGVYIVFVHHRIVLAEERFLVKEFGADYEEYCRRVRRYV